MHAYELWAMAPAPSAPDVSPGHRSTQGPSVQHRANTQEHLHTGNAKREGCVFERMLCAVCCAPMMGQESSPRTATLVQGCPWDSLPLHLLVQLKFLQHPHHSAPLPRAGFNEALSSPGGGKPHLLWLQHHLPDELCPHIVWSHQSHVHRL